MWHIELETNCCFAEFMFGIASCCTYVWCVRGNEPLCHVVFPNFEPLCFPMLCYDMLGCAALTVAVLCCAMLCYFSLCYRMLFYDEFCYGLLARSAQEGIKSSFAFAFACAYLR